MADAGKLRQIRAALDANSGTYSGLSNANAAVEMNDPGGAHSVDNWVPISSAQVFESIDPAEFTSLTNALEARVDRILGLGSDIQTAPGSQARAELIAVFGGGSNTISSLASIANQKLSHAQSIGVGTVEASDVEQARAL